jgi:hypothetical protein
MLLVAAGTYSAEVPGHRATGPEGLCRRQVKPRYDPHRHPGAHEDDVRVQKIGDPIRREKDPRLLRGRGRYVDDVRLPREARGYVLRSPHAHARIQAIDTAAGFLPQSPRIGALFRDGNLEVEGAL